MGSVWKGGPRPVCAPTLWVGGEERPRFRLPDRADKGPSGAPTNGLLLGGLLAGFRRGHKHGATLGSTEEKGKTMGGGVYTL